MTSLDDRYARLGDAIAAVLSHGDGEESATLDMLFSMDHDDLAQLAYLLSWIAGKCAAEQPDAAFSWLARALGTAWNAGGGTNNDEHGE
jgi:hypothetical protein